MLNLLPKSDMSDGDERFYPGSTPEKIVTSSLSFGVEIVLTRQDFRHVCLVFASEDNSGALQRWVLHQ